MVPDSLAIFTFQRPARHFNVKGTLSDPLEGVYVETDQVPRSDTFHTTCLVRCRIISVHSVCCAFPARPGDTCPSRIFAEGKAVASPSFFTPGDFCSNLPTPVTGYLQLINMLTTLKAGLRNPVSRIYSDAKFWRMGEHMYCSADSGLRRASFDKDAPGSIPNRIDKNGNLWFGAQHINVTRTV